MATQSLVTLSRSTKGTLPRISERPNWHNPHIYKLNAEKTICHSAVILDKFGMDEILAKASASSAPAVTLRQLP